MSMALDRFSVYNTQLMEMLQAIAGKREKAWFFYKGHGRDVLFRIEALCRIYREIHHEKFFDTWYKEFKALEDTLGDMDANDALLNEFSGYKQLKPAAEKLFGERLREETGFLDDVLKNNHWLSGEKMKAFTDGLNDISWKDDEEDAVSYAQGMLEELQKLEEKYRGGEIDIFILEDGLHEFRRRIRWLSIYATCGNGLIQLRQNTVFSASFKQYLTKHVTTSRFNVFPKPPRKIEPIIFQSQHFYSLSWLIDHLGELKDTGIRNTAFNELCDIAGVKNKKLEDGFRATNKFEPSEIFERAEMAIDDFIHRDHILERLQRDLLRYIARS